MKLLIFQLGRQKLPKGQVWYCSPVSVDLRKARPISLEVPDLFTVNECFFLYLRFWMKRHRLLWCPWPWTATTETDTESSAAWVGVGGLWQRWLRSLLPGREAANALPPTYIWSKKKKTLYLLQLSLGGGFMNLNHKPVENDILLYIIIIIIIWHQTFICHNKVESTE